MDYPSLAKSRKLYGKQLRIAIAPPLDIEAQRKKSCRRSNQHLTQLHAELAETPQRRIDRRSAPLMPRFISTRHLALRCLAFMIDRHAKASAQPLKRSINVEQPGAGSCGARLANATPG
jgi:hypothetical protein